MQASCPCKHSVVLWFILLALPLPLLPQARVGQPAPRLAVEKLLQSPMAPESLAGRQSGTP